MGGGELVEGGSQGMLKLNDGSKHGKGLSSIAWTLVAPL